ncbi:hypothetical protein [Enhygromyxa salina]|uniref:FG-GAP repeat protein n=1 Tax=Enhygromyxa salina TaxID=215803 RepID=A0A2S9YKK1_9BACT|nr:hypothetical protein [Enhygromyxa salina]PRQ05582.1 FG-GAP repeat protein [Enhygromyxa salina]
MLDTAHLWHAGEVRDEFDPRPWNLFAGATLVLAGCGDRVVGGDDGVTVTTNTQPETSSNTITDTITDTGEDPECITDSDCPTGYYCYDQVCDYVRHHDGSFDLYEYECFDNSECDELELCYFNYCQSTEVAATYVTNITQPAPLPIPGQALSLSFADVDGDGVDELVVATMSELHVFENDVDMPTTSPRVEDSSSIDAMVGGQLDMNVGEDVLLHYEGVQSLHSSDGTSSFLAPSVTPSQIGIAAGMLASDFDQQPPDEVLMWGSSGARVEGGIGAFTLTDSAEVSSAVAGLSGFTVTYSDRTIEFFELFGASGWIGSVAGALPHALFASIGQLELSASRIESNDGTWSLFQLWDPMRPIAPEQAFGFAGEVSVMRRGDFDGDGTSDIAIIADDGLWLHFAALEGVGELYATLDTGRSPAVALSVGDHDGDGDDELAVLLADATVLIFDGELP